MSTQRFRVILLGVAYDARVFSATWYLAYYSIKSAAGGSAACFLLPFGWCEGPGPQPVAHSNRTSPGLACYVSPDSPLIIGEVADAPIPAHTIDPRSCPAARNASSAGAPLQVPKCLQGAGNHGYQRHP